MDKKEEFKAFVKENPRLVKYIKNGEMTWQKFYEIYDIYGNNDEVWGKYFNKLEDETSINESDTSKENFSVSDLINMVKNVDLNSVQKNITNISKALGLVQSLITKDDSTSQVENTYTPRPLYKKFED